MHIDLSSSYFKNPLVKPLIQFHNKFFSTFESLPNNGKALAIVKKVAIVTVSPFAYLALGLPALTGLAFHSSLERKRIRKILKESLNKLNAKENLSFPEKCLREVLIELKDKGTDPLIINLILEELKKQIKTDDLELDSLKT